MRSVLQRGIYHIVVFIESRWFTKRLQGAVGPDSQEVLLEIQNELLANPFRGAIVPGLAGVRKARVGRTRFAGKRGGYRYFYLYVQHQGHMHLLTILDKRKSADLSTEERTIVRKLALALKAG